MSSVLTTVIVVIAVLMCLAWPLGVYMWCKFVYFGGTNKKSIAKVRPMADVESHGGTSSGTSNELMEVSVVHMSSKQSTGSKNSKTGDNAGRSGSKRAGSKSSKTGLQFELVEDPLRRSGSKHSMGSKQSNRSDTRRHSTGSVGMGGGPSEDLSLGRQPSQTRRPEPEQHQKPSQRRRSLSQQEGTGSRKDCR